MHPLTHTLIYHIASGQAFFTGTAGLLVAVCLSGRMPGAVRRTVRNLSGLLGGLLVAASATPLPVAFYVVLLAVSLLWVLGTAFQHRLPGHVTLGLRIAAGVAWTAAVLVEAPAHRLPQVPPMGRPVLGIIGDSLTAGVGEGEAVTWPVLLTEVHGVAVRDHSRMGATVAAALQQAHALSNDERLVVLEIGGNDLLGTTSPAAFETGLEALLQTVCRPGRVVVMLELPLPPTYNAFGRTQRRLARQYGVLLVPKRVLLGVLQQPGSTLDSIHLSQQGHQQMADRIWTVIGPAYQASEDAAKIR